MTTPEEEWSDFVQEATDWAEATEGILDEGLPLWEEDDRDDT